MKKILLVATAMALFAGLSPIVQAQTPPAGTTAPGLLKAAPNFPARATPGAAAGSATATPATTPASVAATTAPTGKKHAKRIPMQQRFDGANTTHDGHLTRAQAEAANWGYVTKHFDLMDTTHKGYVTVADVHAYGTAVRAARVQRKATATPAAVPASGAVAAPATTK